MPALRSAREVCERALRKIGAFSINDSAADGQELDEALHWLDLHMRYLAGTEFATFLQADSVTIDLTGGEASFDLIDRIGDSLPDEGFQFLDHVELDAGAGRRIPVEAVSRQTFARRDNPTETGQPAMIYLDRTTTDPKLYLHPYPATGEDGFDLILTFRTFAPDLKPKGAASRQAGNLATGLRAAWELWAVTITAAACGDGPVRRMPMQEVRAMYADAERFEKRLVTWENREAVTGAPVADRWEIV